jgi:regulatory protein
VPDEPRVARLHLVEDDPEQPAPVARFAEAAPSAVNAPATADLDEARGAGAWAAGADEPERADRASAGLAEPTAPEPTAPEPGPSGLADLGRIAPGPGGVQVPVARMGTASPVARGREDGRPPRRVSPDGEERRPRSEGSWNGNAGSVSAAPGAPGRAGSGKVGAGSEARAGSSSAGPGKRTWGPKQIDPDADPVAAAKEICLALLTDRARTKHELAQALRRRGVPDDAAATALERFDEVGLIDDAAFAGQWVRSRQRSRGLARRALAVELRHKGVDNDTAGEALAEVDDAAEERRARELVDRKLRTVPADTPEQRATAARRLVGMLARKGYPGGIAYRAVREALAAHGAEIDELGEEPSAD